VVALPNGAVSTSDDGGRQWTLLLAGVASISEVALVAHPARRPPEPISAVEQR
jgi:hypothetical protein